MKLVTSSPSDRRIRFSLLELPYTKRRTEPRRPTMHIGEAAEIFADRGTNRGDEIGVGHDEILQVIIPLSAWDRIPILSTVGQAAGLPARSRDASVRHRSRPRPA